MPGGEEAGTPQSDHRPDSGDSDLVQALWDPEPQSAHSQVEPMLFEPRCAVSIAKGVLVKACIWGLGGVGPKVHPTGGRFGVLLTRGP